MPGLPNDFRDECEHQKSEVMNQFQKALEIQSWLYVGLSPITVWEIRHCLGIGKKEFIESSSQL